MDRPTPRSLIRVRRHRRLPPRKLPAYEQARLIPSSFTPPVAPDGLTTDIFVQLKRNQYRATQPKAREIPSPDDLVASARAMIPTLRERSAKAESLRQIPKATVADFKEAGFIRTAQSERFGGYNLGIDTVTRVAVEIGRGCGSSAWMAGQWPGLISWPACMRWRRRKNIGRRDPIPSPRLRQRLRG